MEGQTVYSSYELLDEVFVFKNDSDVHKLLYDIIKDHSHLMLDLTDQEFEKLIIENPFIKALLKRPSKKTYPLKEYFDHIEDNDISQHSRDIFMLNKSSCFCNRLMNQYGILTLCSETLSDVQWLSNRNYKSFNKDQPTLTNNNEGAWKEFFAHYKLNPINSVVVIDNHLFNNLESGKRNLLSLIKAVLPNELETTFQILIVIDNREAKFNSDKLDKIVNEIETELKSSVEYNIAVGIVTHSINEEFHKRILISNYHFLSTDYGFDVFDEKGKAKKTNEIISSGAYFSLKHSSGDPEIILISRKLKEVKKLINKINTTNTKIATDIISGDCNNRFLNDF